MAQGDVPSREPWSRLRGPLWRVRARIAGAGHQDGDILGAAPWPWCSHAPAQRGHGAGGGQGCPRQSALQGDASRPGGRGQEGATARTARPAGGWHAPRTPRGAMPGGVARLTARPGSRCEPPRTAVGRRGDPGRGGRQRGSAPTGPLRRPLASASLGPAGHPPSFPQAQE